MPTFRCAHVGDDLLDAVIELEAESPEEAAAMFLEQAAGSNPEYFNGGVVVVLTETGDEVGTFTVEVDLEPIFRAKRQDELPPEFGTDDMDGDPFIPEHFDGNGEE